MWRKVWKWLVLFGVVFAGIAGVVAKTEGGLFWGKWDKHGEKCVFEKGIVRVEKGKGHPKGTNLTEAVRKRKEEEETENAILERILDTLTIDQKLAQCMILTNEKDITTGNLQDYQPGGIIFFDADFRGKTVEQVAARVQNLQQCVRIPLLVGVDEEGGEISRIRGLSEETIPVFESARELYAKGKSEVVEDTGQKIEWLKRMGINLNFDPVADVVNESQAYMYERSASGDPEEVADYVATVVAVMQDRKMGSCLKHFPGYGNNANTHTTFAIDSKDLEIYKEKDFVPYKAGIAAGAEMIMVSHITMEKVDDENPASLSPAVHALLREEFSFDGVVIADDLNMQAILMRMSLEEAAGQALAAGNDMIFSADLSATMKGARQALQNGQITEVQLDNAVRRILRYKLHLGLLEE